MNRYRVVVWLEHRGEHTSQVFYIDGPSRERVGFEACQRVYDHRIKGRLVAVTAEPIDEHDPTPLNAAGIIAIGGTSLVMVMDWCAWVVGNARGMLSW